MLTAASSNDYFCYERAELLGDSFLKFAASLALFTFYPNLNEGKLTHIKGKIIGNLNLFFCGRAKNIPAMLKVCVIFLIIILYCILPRRIFKKFFLLNLLAIQWSTTSRDFK